MTHASGRFARMPVRSAVFGLFLALICSNPLFAQMGGGGMAQGLLKEKLASIKASVAENQQNLHRYTWTETSVITVNGREMPPNESLCSYGPDGKVQKVPVGGAPDSASGNHGGRLMQRVVERKKADMTDYMQQVGRVIALYVPPDPQKMQQAFEAKKVSFEHDNGQAGLVFKDYEQSGDSMTIDFDTASLKIRTLKVRTWLDSPQDAVTLTVDFATLPDGTNHPSRTTLDAQAKGIHVVSTDSNYRKAG